MGEVSSFAIALLAFVVGIAFYCYLLNYIKADALLWFLFGLTIALSLIEKVAEWEEKEK